MTWLNMLTDYTLFAIILALIWFFLEMVIAFIEAITYCDEEHRYDE